MYLVPAVHAPLRTQSCGVSACPQFFDAFNPTSKTKRRAAFVKEMMRGAANALAFMHEAGVVHRSLGAPSLRVNTLGKGVVVVHIKHIIKKRAKARN